MTTPAKLASKIRATTLAEFDRVGPDLFRRSTIVRRFVGKLPRSTAYRHIARAVSSVSKMSLERETVPSDESDARRRLVEIWTRLVTGGSVRIS